MSDLPSDYSLQSLKDTIKKRGPTRILVSANSNGSSYVGVPPSKVDLNLHFPMIIFIREDGWSIGAHESIKEKAFALYPDQWVAYMDSRFPEEIFEISVWNVMTKGVVKSRNRWQVILEELNEEN